MDGGPGSGNWGHAGRPGKIGGSAKGGGKANRTGSKESGFSSEAKKRAAEKKAAKESGGKPKAKVESRDFKTMLKMNKSAPDDVYYELVLKPQGIKKGSKQYDAGMRQFHTKKWQKENGSNEEWAEENFDKYTESKKKALEDKMSYFQEGDAAKQYEKKVLSPMEKDYAKTVSEYSDYANDIKPREFYELQKKTMEGMTTEDFAIMENSYYHGSEAYESSYTAYTQAKLNGEELNWAQQRLEQIVTDHSVEIPEGKTFFRKTTEEEFQALTGKSIAEFDNNAPASERTATIEKCTSFGTALQYDSFANANILIEYVTKSGAKAFFSTNTDELEGILPPGTKITNITVKGSSGEKVPTIFRGGKVISGEFKEQGMRAAGYDDKYKSASTPGVCDFSYNGQGSLDSWIISQQAARNPFGYNPNYNNLTRVVVEVEG